MKALLTITMLLVLGASTYGFPVNENPIASSIVKYQGEKVQVILRNGSGKVRLTLVDSKGMQVFRKFVQVKSDVQMPLDLSQMPEGEYSLVLEKDYVSPTPEKTVHTFHHAKEIQEYPLVAFGKPVEEHAVKLTVVGLEEPGVDVRIEDASGKVIYRENIAISRGFSKVYRFPNLKTEGLSFTISDNKARSKVLNF